MKFKKEKNPTGSGYIKVYKPDFDAIARAKEKENKKIIPMYPPLKQRA